jgi:peptidyl-prolyl cis-trans isomerase B (cyclophilin B)
MTRSHLALATILMVAAATLVACGDNDDDATSSAAAPAGCAEVSPPEPKEVDLKRPDVAAPLPHELTAVMETSCGSFEIALDTRGSPKTVNSFVYLAEEDVYDETLFHRVALDFVIQGGDPLGTGLGDPGYFVDEPPPDGIEYTHGVVAMAKSPDEPPGRSGSQFFIVTAVDTGIPTPDSAVLGEVSSGEEVVERIAATADPAGETDEPTATVVLHDVTVERG